MPLFIFRLMRTIYDIILIMQTELFANSNTQLSVIITLMLLIFYKSSNMVKCVIMVKWEGN